MFRSFIRSVPEAEERGRTRLFPLYPSIPDNERKLPNKQTKRRIKLPINFRAAIVALRGLKLVLAVLL